MRGKKDRTVTISFRLPKDLVEELVDESERASSSPSAILRQILRKHLHWDRYRIQVNMIPLPSCFVNESLNQLSREEIMDLASRSASAFNGLVLLKMKNTDLESALEVLEDWFTDSSIKYRRGYANGYHVFVIQNDLDVNWSLYLADLFTAVCSNITNTYCKAELNKENNNILLFAKRQS